MGILDGKTAIVTGAARGIGRAIALEYAAAGANVLAASISDGAALIKAAEGLPGELKYFQVDVSIEPLVLALFDYFRRHYDRLDILVNNAGILKYAPLLETSCEDFDQVLAVNQRGMFLCGREGIRIMQQQGSGKVINMASDLSYLGRAEFSAYCSTKAAAMALTKCWSLEFAPNILVNAICPGPIDTDMLSTENMSDDWREKEMDIPLARFGTPKDISKMALFLAGPDSDFITGQGFGVNGGSVMP